MTAAFWILVVGLIGAVIVWRSMSPSLAGPIALAREQGDITPVVEVIERMRPGARPAAYNHAIRQIWDAYERPLAIELVKVLAEKHGSALIAQYWLKQVLQVEPHLARQHITQDFIKAHYQPEVAAHCGPVG